MHDAHLSMCAVFISGTGHVGACRPSTINQGDEGCDNNRAHGDRDGMRTAKDTRSYEHSEIVRAGIATPLVGFPKACVPVNAHEV